MHFRPIGSAPALPAKQVKSTVSAHHPFSFVVRFLRRRLKIRDSEGVFCYLHNCWSPGLDESVGVLWDVSFSDFMFIHSLFLRQQEVGNGWTIGWDEDQEAGSRLTMVCAVLQDRRGVGCQLCGASRVRMRRAADQATTPVSLIQISAGMCIAFHDADASRRHIT